MSISSVSGGGISQRPDHAALLQRIESALDKAKTLGQSSLISSQHLDAVNVILELIQLIAMSKAQDFLDKIPQLFKALADFIGLLEGGEWEYLESQIEDWAPTGSKKRSNVADPLAVFNIPVFNKLQAKHPQLLGTAKITALSASGGSDPFSGFGELSDEDLIELIETLIGDGMGIDDLGELTMIMRLLELLGQNTPKDLAMRVQEAIEEFVEREVNFATTFGEIVALVTAVEALTSSMPQTADTPLQLFRVGALFAMMGPGPFQPLSVSQSVPPPSGSMDLGHSDQSQTPVPDPASAIPDMETEIEGLTVDTDPEMAQEFIPPTTLHQLGPLGSHMTPKPTALDPMSTSDQDATLDLAIQKLLVSQTHQAILPILKVLESYLEFQLMEGFNNVNLDFDGDGTPV